MAHPDTVNSNVILATESTVWPSSTGSTATYNSVSISSLITSLWKTCKKDYRYHDDDVWWKDVFPENVFTRQSCPQSTHITKCVSTFQHLWNIRLYIHGTTTLKRFTCSLAGTQASKNHYILMEVSISTKFSSLWNNRLNFLTWPGFVSLHSVSHPVTHPITQAVTYPVSLFSQSLSYYDIPSCRPDPQLRHGLAPAGSGSSRPALLDDSQPITAA